MKKIKLGSTTKAVIISTIISCICFATYTYFTKEKIGFVRTGILIQDYTGMKEANAQIEVGYKQFQSELDSLQFKYKLYQGMKETGTGAEKGEGERGLKLISEQIENLKKNAGGQLEQQKSELTKTVLDNLNIQISRYAEKHHYTLILGSTSDGSLLYGSDKKDITDELVAELNSDYKKGK